MTCQHHRIETYSLEDGTPVLWACADCKRKFEPVSATPQAQPLTDEQINECYGIAKVQHDHIPHEDVVRITRAIEATHGITAPDQTEAP